MTAKAGSGKSNRDWWPNQLNLKILHQHSPLSNPMDKDFNYAEAFKTLDLAAVKKDLTALMTDSQDWWPADYGHYGPFFIRMAWHSAGTYRTGDGRGGAGHGQAAFRAAQQLARQRQPRQGAPAAVADQAEVRQQYLLGRPHHPRRQLSPWSRWASRPSASAADARTSGRRRIDVYWGIETEVAGRQDATPANVTSKIPLAAVQMGLIYVNPEGPGGNPIRSQSGRDVRETFARMAMNDEETVALTCGGHTFGKCHGAGDAALRRARSPKPPAIEEQGLGWKSSFGSGKGGDQIGSGLEGSWTPTPTQWDMSYLDMLFGNEWVLTKSPAGAHQWTPKQATDSNMAPAAHDASKQVPIIMTDADMAMRMDPIYEPIARRFHKNPEEFADAFARAWFKLTHRDMGPRARYLGPEVPEEELIWQDPIPAVDHPLIDDAGRRRAQGQGSGVRACRSRELVSTAWASASTFRGSDKRGGANGARIRLAPQKDWEANQPAQLAKVLNNPRRHPGRIQRAQSGGKKVSLADLIVLAGCAGVEQAAKNAGHAVTVPFTPGRMDASQEQTDVDSFAVLEPIADGFRNYQKAKYSVSAEELLLDKAQLLTLTAPEMTVLVGGMRVLNANVGQSRHGVFTQRPGALTNDFFVNLLDMGTEWKATSEDEERVRRARSQNRRAEVDRHPRRSHLRFELPAPRPGGSLWERGRAGEVRPRLRGRMEQGDEPGSLRPRVIARDRP